MTDEVPNVRPRARIRTPAPPVAPAPEPEPVEEEEAELEQSIDERQPAIAGIISQVSARMGANVMRRATAVPGFNQTETGIFSLDVALLGGIPEGLVAMLYGWEASGKTTLAKRIAGRTLQKYPDKACIFVDLEQTYDRQWGAKHGIDNERLIIVSPESGEHAVDIIDAVLRAPETGLVIIDSLPAIIPMAEGTASAEDSQVAMRARLIGRLCSKIHHATIASRNAGNAPTTLMINQWRTKIGVMRGDPRVLPGGNQPKFLCTTMIEVKNKEILERNARGLEIVHHNEHSFNIKKSRIGNSARNGEYTMIRDPNHPLGEGAIDEAGVVVAYGKRFGLITGGGSTRRIEGLDNITFRTDANIAEFFEQEPEECLDMKRRIIMVLRQEMGLLALPPDGYLLGPVGA